MSAELMLQELYGEPEKNQTRPRSKHCLSHVSEIGAVIGQLSTAQKKNNNDNDLESGSCNQRRAITNVEESFKSQIEIIFFKYLCTNNKAIPKTGKQSEFEILMEIYKNKDRTTFTNRAAVERLHVELHAKYCTMSSNHQILLKNHIYIYICFYI